MTRFLVTGGAGFIGSALCQKLLDLNHDVHIFDLLYSQDLADIVAISKSLNTIKPDWVVHLAASDGLGFNDCGQKNVQDIVNTRNLIQAMNWNGCNRIIFASSYSIYGQQYQFPIIEHAQMKPQVSFHAASKLACEGLLAAWSNACGGSAITLRLGNVVGPNNRNDHIQELMNRLTATPDSIAVAGNGCIMPYIHIDDVVSAITRISCEIDTGFVEYNVASTAIGTVECIDAICSALGYDDPKIEYIAGANIGTIESSKLSNARLRGLGWAPRYTASEAVKVNTRWLMDNK